MLSVIIGAVFLLTGIGGQLLASFSMPDGGKGGVPDMQEFHVDQNYQASL